MKRTFLVLVIVTVLSVLPCKTRGQSSQPTRLPEPPVWRQVVTDGDPVIDYNNPIDTPKRVWCITNWLIPGYQAKVPGSDVGRYVRLAACEPIDKPIDVWQDSAIVRDQRWFLRNSDGTIASWSTKYPSPVLDITHPTVRKFEVAWWLLAVKQASRLDIDEGGLHPDSPLALLSSCQQTGPVLSPIGLDAAVAAQIALIRDYVVARGPSGERVTFNLGTDNILQRWAQVLAVLETGDGLMDETGFAYPPADTTKRPAWFKQRTDAWRLALDRGCEVLITSYDKRSMDDARLLAAAVCLTYNIGEERKLLFSPAMTHRQFTPPISPDRTPHKLYWWQRDLGPPTGPMKWYGSVVLRIFRLNGRNNYVMINLASNTPLVYVEINGKSE